jgi:hypothetical protein
MPTHSPHRIFIDLAPYNVENIDFHTLIIKDATGSVLGKLNNDPKITRFDSAELKYAQFDKNFWAQVTIDGNDVVFKRVSSRRRITVNTIVKWLGEYFDAIESIGCEVLHSEYREGMI